MNRIAIISILATLGLLYSSCVKETTFEAADLSKKIVVNGFAKNSQEIELTVTSDFVGLGASLESLENAQVAIFQNEVFVENLTYAQEPTEVVGKFSASFIPASATNYRVEVSHPDFPTVETSAVMPPEVAIKEASVQSIGENSYNFSFKIKNPAEANYYYLKMYFRNYELDSITQERNYVSYQSVVIPETAIPNGQIYLDNGYVFRINTARDTEVTITGVAELSNTLIQTDDTELYIHLEHLSEDAYKYYSSHAINLNIGGLDIFSEPISLFSNVENGYGIFAGINTSTVVVEVEN